MGVLKDALFLKIGEGWDHLILLILIGLALIGLDLIGLDWIGLDLTGLDWIGLDWIGSSDFADFADHWLGDKVEGCILWWLFWVSGDAHQNQIEHTVDQILQFPGCHDR